jgi:hypothetical protein
MKFTDLILKEELKYKASNIKVLSEKIQKVSKFLSVKVPNDKVSMSNFLLAKLPGFKVLNC